MVIVLLASIYCCNFCFCCLFAFGCLCLRCLSMVGLWLRLVYRFVAGLIVVTCYICCLLLVCCLRLEVLFMVVDLTYGLFVLRFGLCSVDWLLFVWLFAHLL